MVEHRSIFEQAYGLKTDVMEEIFKNADC